MVDDSYFYWITQSSLSEGILHVWRMPLGTGAVEGFAEIPLSDVRGMATVADGVLVAGRTGLTQGGPPFVNAFVAPIGGSSPRQLDIDPAADLIVSVDTGGAIWSASDGKTRDLGISPPDGSPWTPLSRQLPDPPPMEWGHPGERGERFLGASEPFDDDRKHLSVHWVSSDGSSMRLACDPSANGAFRVVTLAPDALYATVAYASEWTVVKILRPASR